MGEKNAQNAKEESVGFEEFDLDGEAEEMEEARRPRPYNNPRNPTRQEVE